MQMIIVPSDLIQDRPKITFKKYLLLPYGLVVVHLILLMDFLQIKEVLMACLEIQEGPLLLLAT
jgi:hypothetical protein